MVGLGVRLQDETVWRTQAISHPMTPYPQVEVSSTSTHRGRSSSETPRPRRWILPVPLPAWSCRRFVMWVGRTLMIAWFTSLTRRWARMIDKDSNGVSAMRRNVTPSRKAGGGNPAAARQIGSRRPTPRRGLSGAGMRPDSHRLWEPPARLVDARSGCRYDWVCGSIGEVTDVES